MATTESTTDGLTVREQLIRGSLGLIAEEGPVDLSVRRLAQASDRTTMCIYSKFGNRRGLLAASYERAADELLARLDAAAGLGVEKVAAAYRAAADDAPGIYALLLDQPLGALDLESSIRAELITGIERRIANELAAGGNPGAADLAAAAIVWATMHGLITRRLSSPSGESARAWRDRYARTIRAVSAAAI